MRNEYEDLWTVALVLTPVVLVLLLMWGVT